MPYIGLPMQMLEPAIWVDFPWKLWQARKLWESQSGGACSGRTGPGEDVANCSALDSVS